jgi:short-subunit dehydrogenase
VKLLRARTDAEIHFIEFDVTDRQAIADAAAEVSRRFGKVHVLCNSAGVNQLGPMEDATFDDWDWILEVNLIGVVNCLVNFLPLMRSHGEGGHVLNVASMVSFIPSLSAGVYATSKYAVRGLTESLRLSLARHGIGVSLLCPGLTRTNIWEAPMHRPDQYRRSGYPADEEQLHKLRDVHELGMDPLEVGRRALHGILRNDLYIFTHPEFAEELAEVHREVSAAIPREEPDARRLTAEVTRRNSKARAREISDNLPSLLDGTPQDPASAM